jgi:ribosome-associated heat shock protein Hsp15
MSAKAGKAAAREAAEWQRLDLWLWCARVAKGRSDCARLVEEGAVRLNRQPTVKAHAKLRTGDVLTMALRGEVRVWRVMALAARRGPAPEARLLYEEVPEARLVYEEVPEARLVYEEVPEARLPCEDVPEFGEGDAARANPCANGAPAA